MMRKIFRLSILFMLCLTMLLGTACRQNPESNNSSYLSTGYVDNPNYDADDTDSSTQDESTDASDATDVSSDKDNNNSDNNTNENNSSNNTNNNDNTNNSTGKDTTVLDLKGRTITYVAYWEELKKGSSQRANIYWERKEAIEKKYNCKIVHKFMSRDAIDTEVIPSILSGEPIADFFYVTADRAYSLINKKMVYPLSDLKQFDFTEEKWNKITLEAATVNGKVYGLDSNNEPYINGALLYNKDYFEKNNLPDLNELQKAGNFDWDKFREIAKTATKGNVKGFALNASHENTIPVFIKANGGKLVTRTGDFTFDSSVTSKNVVNSLKFWQDMCVVDKSVLATGGTSYLAYQDKFTNGEVAMYFAETYQWANIIKNANFEVGLALFPAGPDSSLPYGISGSASFCVMPSTVKNPEEVALVLDSFNGADKQPWEDYYYDIFYDDDIMDTLKLGLAAVNKKQYVLDYVDCVGDTYYIGLHGAYNKVGNGEMTPAQAVETLAGALAATLDSFE